MSLGLVSYDDSEESDSDVEPAAGIDVNISTDKNNISSSSSVKSNEANTAKETKLTNGSMQFVVKDIESETPGHLLLPESKINSFNTDIDIKCLTSTNKRIGPVKITIPSLNEVEDDAEPPSKKKLKPSQKGSGLFALLPNPKGSLVPQSVVNKHRNITNKKSKVTTPKSSKPVPKTPVINKSTLISYDDSGDEDETPNSVDFFSLEKKEEDLTPAPVDIDVDITEVSRSTAQTVSVKHNVAGEGSSNFLSFSEPEVSSSLPSSSHAYHDTSQYPTQEFMSVSNKNLELDKEAMQQLCGRRDRLKMQEVNIIDVSGDAIMPDSREWLTKQLTEEQTHMTSHKKKDGPTTQQKRKHQITYLAFQAKENELELKNQWANNRMSRKQTQAKYGF